MQLWQNTEVVDALKRILEKYKYLEYDEKYSRYLAEFSGQDKLKIKITDKKKISRNACIAHQVRDELRKATDIVFPSPQTAVRQPYFYIGPPDRFDLS